jgi:hypothetical protein
MRDPHNHAAYRPLFEGTSKKQMIAMSFPLNIEFYVIGKIMKVTEAHKFGYIEPTFCKF